MRELAPPANAFHQMKMEARNPAASRAIGPNFGTSERQKSAAAMPLASISMVLALFSGLVVRELFAIPLQQASDCRDGKPRRHAQRAPTSVSRQRLTGHAAEKFKPLTRQWTCRDRELARRESGARGAAPRVQIKDSADQSLLPPGSRNSW